MLRVTLYGLRTFFTVEIEYLTIGCLISDLNHLVCCFGEDTRGNEWSDV
jgi:hypothetical protein